MQKSHVQLSEGDRQYLRRLVKKGTQKARVFKRATGLLELDRGQTLGQVGASLGVARATVANWREGYAARGLGCLEDAPRSGRPVTIDGTQRAKITALACSEAPAGHARWTLRLLAEKVVELGYCKGLSHTQAGKILKKTR